MDWQDLIDDIADGVQGPRALGHDHAERLWGELRRRLRALAATKRLNRFGLDIDEVEDAVQEVLLRLQNIETLRKVRGARVIQAYLTIMLRNEASNRARSKMREGELGDYAVASHDPVDAATVHDLLNTLSPAERQLIEMKFWEGKTLEEIGQRLGIKTATAGVRVFRLLAKLRDRLGDKPS